jgi:Reverse transcriptase (RNA-dependent DNA polymerase).
VKAWELQKAIHNTASGNIGRKSGNRRDRAVRWWTPTLTDLKRMSYNARRDYQNSDQPPQERHERMQAYYTIRRLYTNAVKATKKESWRDFVMEQAQSNMWSAAYHCHSQRIMPAEAMNAVTTAGSPRLTWTSTAEILMDNLIHPDNPEDDTGEQQVIRQVAEVPPRTGNAGPVDLIDLELPLAKMKRKIKKGWIHLGPQLVDLFNACLRHAVFPRIWKRGRVKYLLKPGDREKTDPGSYRPICLLPVVGKLFEGVLLRLLKPTLEIRSSEAQYRFREVRSTRDDITRLYNITDRWSRATGHSRKDCTGWDWPRTLNVAAL